MQRDFRTFKIAKIAVAPELELKLLPLLFPSSKCKFFKFSHFRNDTIFRDKLGTNYGGQSLDSMGIFRPILVDSKKNVISLNSQLCESNHHLAHSAFLNVSLEAKMLGRLRDYLGHEAGGLRKDMKNRCSIECIKFLKSSF